MDELAILRQPALTQRDKAVWFLNRCSATTGEVRSRFVQEVGKRVLRGAIHGTQVQIERAIAYELQYKGAEDCGQVGDLSPAFLARRAEAIGVVTMAKQAKCEKCGKGIVEGKGLKRPYGEFCGKECLKAHLESPSKQTVVNAAEDAKKIEEASITMKANKGKPGKAKGKAKAAKSKSELDGRVNLEIVPSAESKREINADSKTRFKLGTRMFEAMARIVALIAQGKTVMEIKHWMETNVPGTGYWRIVTSAHPEWFKINPDGTAKYSGPALKVVPMDHSSAKPAKAKSAAKSKAKAKVQPESKASKAKATKAAPKVVHKVAKKTVELQAVAS